MQHARFTDERVARDPDLFEPDIPPESYRLTVFVMGIRRSLDESPYGLPPQYLSGSPEPCHAIYPIPLVGVRERLLHARD